MRAAACGGDDVSGGCDSASAADGACDGAGDAGSRGGADLSRDPGGFAEEAFGMSIRALALRSAFAAYKRVLSPMLHAVGVSNCIYLPTCSEYAYVAVERYGLLRGGRLALARVARCHPLAKGGLDPVP